MRDGFPSSPQIEAWKASYRDTRQGPGPDCPDGDTMVLLVLEQLEGAHRLRVAQHIAGCPKCGAEHRLLLGVHREASGTLRLGSRRTLAPWAAVAAGICAIGLGVLLLRNPSTDLDFESRLRASDLRGTVTRAPEAGILPPDGARLTAAPTRLAWSEQGPEASYRVSLLDAEMTVVWRSETLDVPQAQVPKQALDSLVPGRLYFWSVELVGASQRRLGPYAFEIVE